MSHSHGRENMTERKIADNAVTVKQLFEDLTGQSLPFNREVPVSAISLLTQRPPVGLGYSQFNELLLYFGYDRTSHDFFQFLADGTAVYKSRSSIETIDSFRDGVDRFRKVALLFFGNVKYAFKQLSRDSQFLQTHLAAFEKRNEKNFMDRHERVFPPMPIIGRDTYYLGYVVQKELAAKLQVNPNDAEAQAAEMRRKQVVEQGIKNHNAYLVSDHLDVYIATSMRERHEYMMVHDVTSAIFSHPHLSKLKLRYFDPTQAYCNDRIDKGLAEALMLKRAKCTVYFAQESDTLGKDSELASTLAQGKVVIAYVPRPTDNAAKRVIDSQVSDASSAEYKQAVIRHLQFVEPGAAWNDPVVRDWIDNPATFDAKTGLIRLQAAMVAHFDKRNDLLRNVHPLGIQVNLAKGVANGVLVVNTIEQCAELIRAIMLRQLEFDLESQKENNREYLLLREKISRSIFRVVTGDATLTNAFWNFYLRPSE
jgi:hypothetical protein